ncbi:PREDICTED: melanin-concentrating hormone receptor 1-like [Branchiostoma belcheri]|uniref:Melanin-concentrating hormone receptor 1 n=1 Tax=Branchiostoma belcheri TaxID=7741 RepID=A0A6P4ZPQ5_BRABE|nr:PREDICTED: melanin-concentrating hormone receptor 1-like [Branchiostoma belcheri]KAI8487402.1 Melanin-concentrating hormone receptor 1 [Branchiostoma belcheri]
MEVEEDEFNTSANASQIWNSNVGQLNTIRVTMSVVLYVICVVGLLGNTLVMYVLVRYSKLRNTADVFIFNMALADEVFLLGVPFFAHQFVADEWPFGAVMCKLIYALDANNQFASVYILACMSIDRYLAIGHPIRSLGIRTRKVAAITNVGIWLASLVSIAPFWVFSSLEIYPDGSQICELQFPKGSKDLYWFTVYHFTLAFVLPLTVITVCYLMVLHKLATVVVPSESNAEKRTKKVAKMVLLVVVMFVVCWLPFYVVALINITNDVRPTYAFLVAYFFSIGLGYANSCVNPIIYVLFSSKFRKRTLEALSCRGSCCGTQVHPIDDVNAVAAGANGPGINDNNYNRTGLRTGRTPISQPAQEMKNLPGQM